MDHRPKVKTPSFAKTPEMSILPAVLSPLANSTLRKKLEPPPKNSVMLQKELESRLATEMSFFPNSTSSSFTVTNRRASLPSLGKSIYHQKTPKILTEPIFDSKHKSAVSGEHVTAVINQILIKMEEGQYADNLETRKNLPLNKYHLD